MNARRHRRDKQKDLFAQVIICQSIHKKFTEDEARGARDFSPVASLTHHRSDSCLRRCYLLKENNV